MVDWTESDTLDSQPAWLTAAIEPAVPDLIHHRITLIDTPRGAISFRISDSGVWLESHLEDQLLAHLSAALLSELTRYKDS